MEGIQQHGDVCHRDIALETDRTVFVNGESIRLVPSKAGAAYSRSTRQPILCS